VRQPDLFGKSIYIPSFSVKIYVVEDLKLAGEYLGFDKSQTFQVMYLSLEQKLICLFS